MTRSAAIARAEAYFDSGAFKADLARRVAIPTESQNPERKQDLARYIESEIAPALEQLGFKCRTLTQEKAKGPFLFAERIEDPALPTVLGYGHGDVIRGLDAGWNAGPFALDADRAGRALLRPRRGRQQGPAHHQHRRAGRGAGGARQARLQRQMADRDGRGDRLGRPARGLRRAQGPARRRRAGRLGRAAPHRRPPDHLARHARRLPDRHLDRRARGRPPFGQLGRAAVEPGDPARACALDHHGTDRADPHPRMGAGPHSGLGAARARRLRDRSPAQAIPRSIRTGPSPA